MSEPKHFNAVEKKGDWVLFTDYQEMYFSFQKTILELRDENTNLKIKLAESLAFQQGWNAAKKSDL